MLSDFAGERIWIIGASSGIGEALALLLAGKGARLILSARRETMLASLQRSLPHPSEHQIMTLDVAQPSSIEQALRKAYSDNGMIDRIIYLAAIYHPTSLAEMDLATAENIIDINLTGTLRFIHFLQPYLPVKGNNNKPQIAICGSVAGYNGLPQGQPYSASKAALISLTESFQAERPDLEIKLISPGFVDTPLTRLNQFTMPGILSPQQAAIALAAGLQRRGFEIHFPKRVTYCLKLLRFLPYRLYFKLVQKLRS